MLPKLYRLTKKEDFQKVLKKGKMVQGSFFGMALLKEDVGSSPKFGVIVSNKISKSAVVRNRIRRLLSEALAGRTDSVGKDTRIVFLAKRAASGATLEDVSGDIDRLLQKQE
jgi:ribonuclease P protein component